MYNNIILLKQCNNAIGNLFLIHDGTGGIEGYINLVKKLPAPVNIFGINGSHLIDLAPVELNLAEIAKNYASKIIEINTDTELTFIAGWSAGGSIASEVTIEINRMSKPIKACFIIDSDPPGYFKEKHIETLTVVDEYEYVQPMIVDKDFSTKLKYCRSIVDLWNIVDTHSQQKDLFNIEAFVKDVDCGWGCPWINAIPYYQQVPLSKLFKITNLMRSLHYARTYFWPSGVIDIPVVLFYSEESETDLMEPWRRYCKNSCSVRVSGEHYSLFAQQNINSIVSQLTNYIYRS